MAELPEKIQVVPSRAMRALIREMKDSNAELLKVTKETGTEMRIQNDALIKILAGLERRVRKLEAGIVPRGKR